MIPVAREDGLGCVRGEAGESSSREERRWKHALRESGRRTLEGAETQESHGRLAGLTAGKRRTEHGSWTNALKLSQCSVQTGRSSHEGPAENSGQRLAAKAPTVKSRKAAVESRDLAATIPWKKL